MDIKDIKTERGASWNEYKTSIQEALATNNPLLLSINNYLLKNSGKELRPVLSLLAGQACGTLSRKNFCCAAVSEMIHTATLLHDDVADSGDTRRGSPTVRIVFGNPASVLTGDYWLSQALKSICKYCNNRVLECFTNALAELSGGELLQMEKASELTTTRDDYYEIIRCKTSSLFIAAMKSSLLCFDDVKKECIDAIEEFALYLGYAFQIKDDIFDYSPSLETGKASGSDLKERKITLPLICAMENAGKKESNEVIYKLSKIGMGEAKEEENLIIDTINTFVNTHNGVFKAQTELDECITKAINALSVIPDSPSKTWLIKIALYLTSRKY